MKVINLNSKKIAVQLNTKILGELVEIENIVEKIGQYGNITKYRLASENNKSIIYLDLQEDYKKFAVVNGNHEIIDKQTNKIFKATDTPKQTLPDGSQAQEVLDPETNKTVLKKLNETTTEEVI